jgi:hypothetical protein
MREKGVKGALKNAAKAAFLSGVIFPGVGQLVLKRYKRGIAWMLGAGAGFVVMGAKAVQQSFTILEKIESQGGAIDLSTIVRASSQASTASGSLIFYFALFLIIFCWIFSVVDAYRIGKKMGLEE